MLLNLKCVDNEHIFHFMNTKVNEVYMFEIESLVSHHVIRQRVMCALQCMRCDLHT